MDTWGSPSGCVPFIVHGEQVIADSRRIIEYLARDHRHARLDRHLTPLEHAVGNALERMVEYSMNPVVYRVGFVDHPCVGTRIVGAITGAPEWLARRRVLRISRWVQRTYRYIPFGALTRAQYENEFLRDCEAVEQQIGDKPFLFGDEPTSYDCALYALLIPLLNMKSYAEVSDIYRAVAQSPILVEYLHRLTERAFPDLEELLDLTNAARSEVAAEEEEGAAA
ncbi:hypothetical protein STCU_09035 [Strigomonas culicis]|uniref:GST N-terminal domain-containing protein n=1 Tax=Strigomonas culicis TaxID=28005 RepID=S9V0C2_9TRYP|nr:hypothetical protein STCU_09035 [Strigomonas culicis]|eukprot:EPY20351.1 hypothetical protein STCU_09035 [Strigomonas culicis]